jgi:hypothetical protein
MVEELGTMGKKRSEKLPGETRLKGREKLRANMAFGCAKF